jgi:hypothetical protein
LPADSHIRRFQGHVRIELEAVADALRQGTRATVQELALIKREWAFPLSIDRSGEVMSVLASYVK